uniref:Uncharacterized protein n=1 Tax=Anguilla anguilla TaxID=7936 RepID=A0A0E9U435_ANGAN
MAQAGSEFPFSSKGVHPAQCCLE